MYSYLKYTNECGRTPKGIKKNVIKKDIKHENYKDVLLNNEQVYNKMKTIPSQRHQLGSYEINKISLSCFDEKHYLHEIKMEYTVLLMVITRYNLVHFLVLSSPNQYPIYVSVNSKPDHPLPPGIRTF